MAKKLLLALWLLTVGLFAVHADIMDGPPISSYTLQQNVPHTPCGVKTNYVLQPWAPGNLTQVAINNLNQIPLCIASEIVNGPGTTQPSGLLQNNRPVMVYNFQMSSYNCAGSAAVCQAAADITASGVSTTNTIGGLDTGTVASNTDYCLWLVSKGTHEPSATGLVWSTNCAAQGPNNVVQSVYPYFAYMGWNRTNGSCPGVSCAFLFSTLTTGQWTYFTGGTGTGGSGTGALPQIKSGTATQWTSVSLFPGFTSPHGDAFIMAVTNTTGSTVAGVAPDIAFGNNLVCNNSGIGTISCGPFTTDRGNFGWWSTSSSAILGLVGFHDGQL